MSVPMSVPMLLFPARVKHSNDQNPVNRPHHCCSTIPLGASGAVLLAAKMSVEFACSGASVLPQYTAHAMELLVYTG